MILLQGDKRWRVEQLEFSPDGETLAVPCSRGVHLYAPPAAGAKPGLLAGGRRCASAHFTPDGRHLIAMGESSFMAELPTGRCRTLPDAVGAVPSPDGRWLMHPHGGDLYGWITCHPIDDPGVTAWELDAGRRWYCTRPMFLPDGRRFLTLESWVAAGVGGVVYAHVTRAFPGGAVLDEVPCGEGADRILTVTHSADRRLYAELSGWHVHVFRADAPREAPAVLALDRRHKSFTGLGFHPSGGLLAVTSFDGAVHVYETRGWTRLHCYNWDVGPLRSVTFSPDGMRAAAGGDAGRVFIWDVDF